jgi:hypothetical protein
MEETASRYGGKLRVYSISSRAQPTIGGTPAWGLGEALSIHSHVTKYYTVPQKWRAVLNLVMNLRVS